MWTLWISCLIHSFFGSSTVKPLITNTLEEFIKCRLDNFSMSFILSIYKFGLSVCLYPINVKTAEPIGPKFFVGHLGTPGKVYESSKFQKFVSIKIRSSLNFLKFWKSAKFFVKIRELFLFCFTMYTKRTCSQLI